MARVFYPDAEQLTKLGFKSVATVPAIFDRSHRYQRAHNRYLRERATAQTDQRDSADILPTASPRQQTISNIASHLAIFIDYCTDHSLQWQNITYQQCLTYQNAMASGRWSPSGKRLARSTANIRTDEAVSFLVWAAGRGLRAPFDVPYKTTTRIFTSGTSSHYGRTSRLMRVGRLKCETEGPTTTVSLPSRRDIADWLISIKNTRGVAKYLACRFIVETGVRLHEAVALIEIQIPTISALDAYLSLGRVTAPIDLTVTKGGRPRTIQVGIGLLSEIRGWIETKRLRLRYLYTKRTGRRASTHVFLSDARGHEGTPIQRHTIYACFKDVHLAHSKWHPHFARHTYACLTVLETLQQEAKAAGFSLRAMGADWINARGSWILRTLQTQLGHISDKTTALYLRWLNTASGTSDAAVAWHTFLSESEPS